MNLRNNAAILSFLAMCFSCSLSRCMKETQTNKRPMSSLGIRIDSDLNTVLTRNNKEEVALLPDIFDSLRTSFPEIYKEYYPRYCRIIGKQCESEEDEKDPFLDFDDEINEQKTKLHAAEKQKILEHTLIYGEDECESPTHAEYYGTEHAYQDRKAAGFNKDDQTAYFLVADGHGMYGDEIAQFVIEQSKTFIEKIKKLHAAGKISDIPHMIREEIFALQKKLATDKKSKMGGTTLTALYIVDDMMWTVNIGDSRTVLTDGDRVIFTIDHKPGNEKEKVRIKKEGGFVKTPEPVKCGEGLIYDVPRVYFYLDKDNKQLELGGLGMTRALGDTFMAPAGVNCEPDITAHKWRGEDGSTLFTRACLASDGVWDVISSSDAAEIMFDTDPEDAAERIVKKAYDKGSRDDITTITVNLEVLAKLFDSVKKNRHEPEKLPPKPSAPKKSTPLMPEEILFNSFITTV